MDRALTAPRLAGGFPGEPASISLPGPLDAGTPGRPPDPSTASPCRGVARIPDALPDGKQVVTKSRLESLEICEMPDKIVLKCCYLQL